MASSAGCQFCSELMDRFRLLAGKSPRGPTDDTESITLGKLSDIIEMPCPHADSIRRMWERTPLEELSPERTDKLEAARKDFFEPRHWIVNVRDSSNMRLALFFVVPDTDVFVWDVVRLIHRPDVPGHAGMSEVLSPQWTDPSIMRMWYEKCMEDHGDNCHQPDWMRLRPESIAMPEWLVDVVDNCVVECNSDTARYIALSYTWGSVECLKHNSQTLKRLRRRGSLHPARASDIPRTVRDAFEITKLLGERYLWVDSLCIPQGEETAAKGLNSMHHIYANSMICLVAFAGTDANHGLRGIDGVSAARHLDEYDIYDIADGERLSWIPRPRIRRADEIPGPAEGSEYNKRGWTYQEWVFAKRRLVFTGGLLRWTCACAGWSEEVHGDIDMQRHHTALPGSLSWMTSPGPDMKLIEYAAAEFNTRYFTYEGDALKAFLGIQNHISRDFLGGLNYGHPEIFFDISLLWQAESSTQIVSKRRLGGSASSDPPSWSWMGWQGQFWFDRDEEYKTHAQSDVGFTQSVAQWYKMQTPLASASDMEPVNCQWQIHRAAVKNGSADIPLGWQKFPTHKFAWGHGYLRVVADEFAQDEYPLSDSQAGLYVARNFKYPIPLPPYTETFRSIEQCPFIFARTTRSFFTAKSFPRSNANPTWDLLTQMHPHGLFCQNGEGAGLLRLRDPSDGPTFEVEVVAVVKGWTGLLSRYFDCFEERKSAASPEWSDKDGGSYTRQNCYFVLCIKWENGVAKRLGTGMVEADIWERNQEPVDLILG